MNKYLEAFEHLCKHTEQLQFLQLLDDSTFNKGSYEEDKRTIKELVDKATPMRVTDIHVDEFYCPKCSSEISHNHDCQLPNFCKECGQRLE